MKKTIITFFLVSFLFVLLSSCWGQTSKSLQNTETLRSYVSGLLNILYVGYYKGGFFYPHLDTKQFAEREQTEVESLKDQIRRLQVVVNEQEAEIRRLRQLCQEKGIEPSNTKREDEGEPNVAGSHTQVRISGKSVFGIFLGEKISEVQRRFNITRTSFFGQNEVEICDTWTVQHYSDVVDKCTIQTFRNRVALINIFFKDNSELNFNVLKEQIEKKYEIKGYNPITEVAFEFSPKVDGIPIFIYLNPQFKYANVNRLSVTYIHRPIIEELFLEGQRRKVEKIKSDL